MSRRSVVAPVARRALVMMPFMILILLIATRASAFQASPSAAATVPRRKRWSRSSSLLPAFSGNRGEKDIVVDWGQQAGGEGASAGRPGRHRRRRRRCWGRPLGRGVAASSGGATTTTARRSSSSDDVVEEVPSQRPQPSSSPSATAATTLSADEQMTLLRQENDILRSMVSELEAELARHTGDHRGNQHVSQRIVVEQFEGEGRPTVDASGAVIHSWFEGGKVYEGEEEDAGEVKMGKGGASGRVQGAPPKGEERGAVPSAIAASQPAADLPAMTSTAMSKVQPPPPPPCDESLPDGTCPLEPDVSFGDALRSRAYWLVGLLAFQSCSGFILSRNEELLQGHPAIVYFLTMLVGAGGNAGNQASVRVIRGLALGTLNEQTQRQFLNRELRMATALSSVLSLAGFARAAAFRTPLPETVAVTAALTMIVFSSICLGAVLPLLLKRIGVDPAHSSTTIQVVMDILGVVLTVLVSTAVLDSPVGQLIMSKLHW